jgi:hypothetical protein
MTSNWMDGYGPPRPMATPAPRTAPPPPKSATGKSQPEAPAWQKGQRRILVEAMCCEECGHLRLRRRDEYGAIAYWQCERCGHRQKESTDAGKERAHLA